MTRDEIEALLPFHVNGTLEGDEAAAVEVALAEDPQLRAEAEALAAIRATMQADEEFSPGEMGLARLMRDVDAAPHTAPQNAPLIRPAIWRVAAAVLLAIAVGQAALLTLDNDQPGYELAGAAEADFTLAFDPVATEADIRQLLQLAGAEIVGGPSALGLYSIAVLDGTDPQATYDTLAGAGIVESISRD